MTTQHRQAAATDVRAIGTPEAAGEHSGGIQQVIAPVVVGVAVAVFLVAPRTALAIAAVLAIAPALLIAAARPTTFHILQPFGGVRERPWLVIALATGAYLLFSALSSPAGANGYGKAVLYLALIGLAALAARSSGVPSPVHTNRLLRGAWIGFAAGLVYLAIEESFGHPIRTAFFQVFPALAPDRKHLRLTEEGLAGVATYTTNRSMAAIGFLLFPLLLATVRLWSGGWRRLAMAALIAGSLLAILQSEHETSVIAVVAGGAALVCVKWLPRAALLALAAVWTAGCLLVVPATWHAYHSAAWHQATWLPFSARHRIVLWGYTAHQVAERPLLGVGIDATKPIDEARRGTFESVRGRGAERFEWRTSPHPHNIYLQVWYELGVAGALLLCALGNALLWAIWRAQSVERPYLAATFVVAATMGSFTWGLWQPWFMGAFAVAAVMALLARGRPKEHGARV